MKVDPSGMCFIYNRAMGCGDHGFGGKKKVLLSLGHLFFK